MTAAGPGRTAHRAPRNGGRFRKHGIADPAPLLADADAVRRAAKVLAAARQAKPSREERSAWVRRHIAALQADIAKINSDRAEAQRLADQAAPQEDHTALIAAPPSAPAIQESFNV